MPVMKVAWNPRWRHVWTSALRNWLLAGSLRAGPLRAGSLLAGSLLAGSLLAGSLLAGCGSSPGDDDATSGDDDATSGDDDTAAVTPTPSLEALCSWDGPLADAGPFVDPWWQDGVFYEIFVRSFQDSDGDGVGDLKGLTSQLDYLNDGDPTTDDDLGITGIWLMPIFDSPSDHGYDTTDYYHVNPDYGTESDLETLLTQAHQRGIRVILDLALNHTSNQHPWFKDSESSPEAAHRNWYVWASGSTNSKWHADNGAWYYAAFDGSLPDLNYYSSELRTEMSRVYDYWLELGVDGFRLDGLKYLVEEGTTTENSDATHCYLEGQRRYFAQKWPDRMLVGEVYDSVLNITPYFGDGSDQLPLAFDFPLSSGIIDSINKQSSSSLNIAMANRAAYYPAAFPGGAMGAPFLRNHDMDRTGSVLPSDEARKLAAILLLSSSGTPFMYYGEEIGMTGLRGSAPNDNARRTPMQWTGETGAGFTTGTPWYPINADYASINVAGQTSVESSLLSLYRRLVRMRLADDALRRGGWSLVSVDQSGAYAFLRGTGEGAVLVVVNLTLTALPAVSVDLSKVGSWGTGIDLLTNYAFAGPISGSYALGALPAYGARLIKLTGSSALTGQ